jgi:S1-C subfamily serine protease
VLAAGGVAAHLAPWSSASAEPVRTTAARSALDTGAVADDVEPAVVNITTELAGGAGEAAGTGIVLTSSGRVLTNNHVIANATDIEVAFGGSNRGYDAEVLGYDVANDVALLQVDGASGLPTADLGDPSDLAVGDAVVALGNALGRGGAPAVTSGSVLALEQAITVSDESGTSAEQLDGLIESDAPLQPGESGGPLVDDEGEVIGMNTAAQQSSQFDDAPSDTAYAIPIDDALAVVEQIESGESNGTVHVGERAMVGLQVRDVGRPGRFGGPGGPGGISTSGNVQVVGIPDDSPAAATGIEAGDVLVSLDGTTIRSTSDLSTALAPLEPGDEVEIVWLDGTGRRHSDTVTLVAGPPA